MSTAGTNKIAILSGLKTLLNTLSDFTDEVYISYRTQTDAEKFILVHLHRDRPVTESTGEKGHFLHVNASVRFKTNLPKDDAEQELLDFIELVGTVEDLLEDNYYNAGVWEDLVVDDIAYTFGQQKSFVWYNGMMRLIFRSQW